jgi:hypothetical protein
MRAAIVTLMEADATLMGYLTGGVHAVREISRTDTPGAFDAVTKELKPSALVKLSTEPRDGPRDIAGMQYIHIYLYERNSYTAIDQAKDRMRTILHRIRPGNGTWQVRHVEDILDQEDAALGSNLHMSRYLATIYRG